MKKRYLIGAGILIITIIALAINFIVNKTSSINTSDIESIVYEESGGIAGTIISITIDNKGNVTMEAWNKPAKKFKLEEEKYQELTKYIFQNMNIFDKKLVEDKNLTDGYSKQLTVTTKDKKYTNGGYAIFDKEFNEFINNIKNYIGNEIITEYLSKN